MSEKQSGGTMRELVAAVAGARQWGDTRESWIARSARNAGVSYRQAKALFYGEITDDEHKTVRKMRAAARAAAIAAGRCEAAALADRFETLARSLDVRDQGFHGSDIAALVHAARALRGLAGPGNNET